MIPFGLEWKQLLEHLVSAGRWSDAEQVVRSAEVAAETPDERALLELERAALLDAAGRPIQAAAAIELASAELDALSVQVRIQVDLACADVEARQDPIAALTRAHAADQRAVGIAPPHLRLSTLCAILRYCQQAGIRDVLAGLADMVVQQAGFVRDPVLLAGALVARAELAYELDEDDALRRARDAHAAALRLPDATTQMTLIRRAAACRGRAARAAGEVLEGVECFAEATDTSAPSPAWVVELALARQAAGLGNDGTWLADALQTLATSDAGGMRGALGALLIGEGQLEAAAAVVERLPDGALQLGLRARIALMGQSPEPTRAVLNAALKDGSMPVQARPMLRMLLAALHAVAGDQMDALDCLDHVLESSADRTFLRQARIQRSRLLAQFADYDGAYVDAEQAWDDARAAFDPQSALLAAAVLSTCLLAWDREGDALALLTEATTLAENLGATRIAASAQLEIALIELGLGEQHKRAGLERLLAGDDASTKLRTLTSLALARNAADQGDVNDGRHVIAELRRLSAAQASPSPSVAALVALAEGSTP